MDFSGRLDLASINKMKVFGNELGRMVSGLTDKNVVNNDEFKKIEKNVCTIVNNTVHLIEDIKEKTEMAGKLVGDHFANSKKQLCLKFHVKEEDGVSSQNHAVTSSSSGPLLGNVHSTFFEFQFHSESTKGKKKENLEQNTVILQKSIPLLRATEEFNDANPSNVLKLCPADYFYKMMKEKAGEIYPVMEKEGRTRLALIICNQKFDHLQYRNGVEKDLVNMRELLESLGYSVVVRENLTAKQMKTELMQFADRPEHLSSDSTFLVFMSHGILEGICGVEHTEQDPDVLPDDTIFNVFNNCNCTALRNKPKVIIMQACRGKGVGTVYVSADKGTATTNTNVLHRLWSDSVTIDHVEKDFIAFKSSTPHNKSYRDDNRGSFFITQLIACFQKYSCLCHLEDVFQKVQQSFEKPSIHAQMPTIERKTLTRHFYLFPGH